MHAVYTLYLSSSILIASGTFPVGVVCVIRLLSAHKIMKSELTALYASFMLLNLQLINACAHNDSAAGFCDLSVLPHVFGDNFVTTLKPNVSFLQEQLCHL